MISSLPRKSPVPSPAYSNFELALRERFSFTDKLSDKISTNKLTNCALGTLYSGVAIFAQYLPFSNWQIAKHPVCGGDVHVRCLRFLSGGHEDLSLTGDFGADNC
ncbi:unnamed protein product [Cylicocyclus nassatus]|uniref:Uncharacterized protein n=1 Tax=Cylicocyclus nassatus TaxID=53992 RepID=A0AA36GGI4_CYLNA|nr:unnamed protein product [Cylicocyclus nassatus]